MSLQSRISALITAIGADIKVLQAQQWTVITKPSDESVASSSVAQNDDHLQFVSVSGAVYEFEFVVIYGSPAGAGTPDINLVVGEDGTVRGVALIIGLSSGDAATTTTIAVSTGATVTIRGTGAANRTLVIKGTLDGGGGTFKLMWAQATSGVNATIVRSGSILRYRRVT